MTSQSPPRWAEKYLGIPFALNKSAMDGCDCVGLCQLVMWEEAMVRVPRGDIYVSSVSEFEQDVVKRNVGTPPWSTVVSPEEAKAFDWVLMWAVHKKRLAPLHVGIVSAPGWILHVQEDVSATQQKIKHLYDRIILVARHDAIK